MARGKFITFEGGEGAGKSTQVERLRSRLVDASITVIATREPGGTPEGDMIRKLFKEGSADRWDPASEALLMYAARKEHVIKVIEPALAAGTWVISDRFSDSTMAYQGYAQGLGHSWVSELHQLTLGSFQPDVTFVIDLPIEVSLARMQARGGGHDRMERQGPEFHEALRSAFIAIAAENRVRCHVILGDLPEDEIAEAIWHNMSAMVSEVPQ